MSDGILLASSAGGAQGSDLLSSSFCVSVLLEGLPYFVIQFKNGFVSFSAWS